MNFKIFDHTIYLTIVGSQLYGTATEESDIDVCGIAIAPISNYFGLTSFNQREGKFEGEELDYLLSLMSPERQDIVNKFKCEGSIYNVDKFVTLAQQSNPNILDVVFAPASHQLIRKDLANRILDNKHLFLSKQMYRRFLSYGKDQLGKMKTHFEYLKQTEMKKPLPEDFGLQDVALSAQEIGLIQERINQQFSRWEGHFPSDLSPIQTDMLKRSFLDTMYDIELTKEARRQLAEDKLMLNADAIKAIRADTEYRKALENWKSFNRWKSERSEARMALEVKHGFDTKFAMHAIRLMSSAVDILETGTYNVARTDEKAQELKNIRAGKWSYEDVLAYAESLEARSKILFEENPKNLPNQVDVNKVSTLLTSILSENFGIKE